MHAPHPRPPGGGRMIVPATCGPACGECRGSVGSSRSNPAELITRVFVVACASPRVWSREAIATALTIADCILYVYLAAFASSLLHGCACSCDPSHFRVLKGLSIAGSLAYISVGFLIRSPMESLRPVAHWCMLALTMCGRCARLAHGSILSTQVPVGCSRRKNRL